MIPGPEETPERYARLQRAFEAARTAPRDERSAILDEACAGDAGLRAEVESLLDQGTEETPLLSEAGIRGVRARLGELVGEASGRLDPWQPVAIAGYRVLRRIGEGGMGIVFEAEQDAPRRRVALKLLHPQRSTPDRLRRLKQEAELLGRLQHPGIARIYESGTFDAGHGAQPFFAMELVEGRDLRHHVEQGGLGPREVLALVARIADAVHHAHRRGVIHRDLKPENVMVDAAGQPHVLDFGVARVHGGSDLISTFRTRDGVIVGTLAYMAPEQLEGDMGAITPRTDVYSLGVLTFELLTGRLPHQVAGLELPAALRVLQDEPDQRLAALDRSLSGDVQTIVETAMAREPERRYGSAEALAADLRRYLDGAPIAARPPTRTYRAAKFVRKHRALATSVLLVVASLVFGLGVSLSQYRRAARARRLADERYEEVLQLADLERVEEARAAAEELWPAVPALAGAMEDWLREHADPLRANLPRHRATLRQLREGAELVREGPGPPRWRLASDEGQWQHDAVAGLIDQLEQFFDPDPHLGVEASVRGRLAEAARVERASVGAPGPAARWEACIADVAGLARYEGLALAPQLGLVPLRRDPRSGLWEFWHVPSGAEPALGDDDRWIIEEPTGVVLVLLPGGRTTMGAQDADPAGPHHDPLAEPDEGPVHGVTLDPFFLSKYELTQAQWRRATGARPSNYGVAYRWPAPAAGAPSPHANRASNPVEQVSWTECDRVLRQLGLALPTEAQWEYGARGGTATPWWSGADPGSIGARRAGNVADARARAMGAPSAWPFEAWEDPWIVHAPTGSFAPNPFGLHDTLGNVFEWCADVRAPYGLPVLPGTGERVAPGAQDRRIARGGSFGLGAAVARSSVRYSYTPAYRNDLVGVRPARPVQPPGAGRGPTEAGRR